MVTLVCGQTKKKLIGSFRESKKRASPSICLPCGTVEARPGHRVMHHGTLHWAQKSPKPMTRFDMLLLKPMSSGSKSILGLRWYFDGMKPLCQSMGWMESPRDRMLRLMYTIHRFGNS